MNFGVIIAIAVFIAFIPFVRWLTREDTEEQVSGQESITSTSKNSQEKKVGLWGFIGSIILLLLLTLWSGWFIFLTVPRNIVNLDQPFAILALAIDAIGLVSLIFLGPWLIGNITKFYLQRTQKNESK